MSPLVKSNKIETQKKRRTEYPSDQYPKPTVNHIQFTSKNQKKEQVQMKCKDCGKEIPSDSNFCEYCGTSLHVHRDMKKTWIISTVMLSFCVVALIIAYCHERSLYEYTLDRLILLQGKTSVVEPVGQGSEEPVIIDGHGKDSKGIIQQRDSLLLEVSELQEKTRKLQNKVNELDEENGYLTTDVRLATEALKECMGK